MHILPGQLYKDSSIDSYEHLILITAVSGVPGMTRIKTLYGWLGSYYAVVPYSIWDIEDTVNWELISELDTTNTEI